MTTQPSLPSSPPIGAVAVVLLACPLYIVMLAAIFAMPGGDPGSYGAEGSLAATLSALFALIFGGLLWIALAGLLTIGALYGDMPHWAKIAAAVLYPLSGIAALTAGGLSYSYPGGWLVLVVAVLPPLIALYAIWARLPALHTTFRPDVTSAVLLGAIGVVILATLPLAYVDELLFPGRLARQDAEAQALIAEREAEWARHRQEEGEKFRQLTPDSPLRDYLNPAGMPEGDAGYRQALEGARQVKQRQIEAVALIEEGKVRWLKDLAELDLQATPALCNAFDAALRKDATKEGPNWNVGEELERQLPNMKWLVAEHCRLDAGVNAVETRVRLITGAMGEQDGGRPRWMGFLTALAQLHQPR
jgi:hypothetical protein